METRDGGGENNVPLMQSQALAVGPAPICISLQSACYTFFMNAERELATDCCCKSLLLGLELKQRERKECTECEGAVRGRRGERQTGNEEIERDVRERGRKMVFFWPDGACLLISPLLGLYTI